MMIVGSLQAAGIVGGHQSESGCKGARSRYLRMIKVLEKMMVNIKFRGEIQREEMGWVIEVIWRM